MIIRLTNIYTYILDILGWSKRAISTINARDIKRDLPRDLMVILWMGQRNPAPNDGDSVIQSDDPLVI